MRVSAFLLAVVPLYALASSAKADGPPSPTAPVSDVPSGAAFLEKVWPGHPEWLAMLADIAVRGNRISGQDGWFRKSGPKSRFGWEHVRAILDKDGDGRISPEEYKGTSDDFARLDRDRDGVLGPNDFDFNTPTQGPAVGPIVFNKVDRDGNGKVTRDEMEAFFISTDKENLGFASLDDFKEAFSAPPMTMHQATAAHGGLTRGTFLKSFLRRELGPFPPGPDLETPAPEGTR